MEKLKRAINRKPKTLKSHKDIIRAVAEDTGFTQTDVGLVLDVYASTIRTLLLELTKVKIKGVATLFPVVMPEKRTVDMNGYSVVDGVKVYDSVMVPPRWKLWMSYDSSLGVELKETIVTKKDLENIYNKKK